MISALVSQSRGLAIFDDGKTAAALLDAESEPLTLTERELSRLLRGAHDIEALVVSGLSELRAALRERCLREQVLHATLLVIDGQSSRALRVAAGVTLAHLAAPDAIARWVECILMSVPAPAESDFAGAREVVRDDRMAALIQRVESYQSRIRSVFATYVAVCRKCGVGVESPMRRRAIEEGWFRALVLGERLFLGESDEAWGFVEQWIASLVQMLSSHAVVVRPAVASTASSGTPERLEDAGWVIWPLSSETEDSNLSVRSASSVLLDVWAASRDASRLAIEQVPHPKPDGATILLEDLNLRRAERLLCEEALARAGSIPDAAQLLGITRHALKRRLMKHRIEWPNVGIKPTPWEAFKVIVGRKSESERGRRLRTRRFAVGRVPKSKTVGEA